MIWCLRESNDRISYIYDRAHERTIILDGYKHEYAVGPKRVTWAKNAIRVDSSQTQAIEMATRDTGQQQRRFGYTARRYVTTRRMRLETAWATATEWQESTTETWFLDAPVPEGYKAGVAASALLIAFNKVQPALRVSYQGVRPRGILIASKTSGGGSDLQATEVSTAPLEAQLFEAPAGYRQVAEINPGERLSWDEQVEQCRRSVETGSAICFRRPPVQLKFGKTPNVPELPGLYYDHGPGVSLLRGAVGAARGGHSSLAGCRFLSAARHDVESGGAADQRALVPA